MVDSRLISLLKIVEYGSYTKAAKQLSLTQPAISQHIKSLETTFGVKVFERSGGKMKLTRQGESIVAYAKRIIVLTERLKESFDHDEANGSTFNVGVTSALESNAVVEALAAYVKANPGLNFKIVTASAERLQTMLQEYEVDFAVIEGKIADPDMNVIRIDTDNLVLCAAPSNHLAKQKQITLSHLKKEKLILKVSGFNTSGFFVKSLEEQSLSLNDFNVVMEVESVETIKDLVRHDYGVSVIAKSACCREVKNGDLVALDVERLSTPRDVSIVYPKDFRHNDLINGIVKSYGCRIQA